VCVCVCVLVIRVIMIKIEVEISKIGGLLMFFQIFIKHKKNVCKFDCHLLVY